MHPLMQIANDISKYVSEILPEGTAFVLILANEDTLTGSSNLAKDESTVALLEGAIVRVKGRKFDA